MDVSSPFSSNYGKHWSSDEVSKTFAPSETALNATTTWLQDAGIGRKRIIQTENQGFITFDATIEELENLLKTEYHLYRHWAYDKPIVACDHYYVPTHLKRHIDFISPGIGSPVRSLKKRSSNELQKRQQLPPGLPPPGPNNFTLQNCWQGIFPQCINTVYGIPQEPTYAPGNEYGIFEVNSSYVQSDMDKFFQEVAVDIPVGTTANNVLLYGAELTTNFTLAAGSIFIATDIEADLDFQLAWPLVYPQNITLFATLPTEAQLADILQTNSTDTQEEYLGLDLSLDDVFSSFDGSNCYNSSASICGVYQAPTVLSVSYSSNEMEVSEAVSKRFCNEVLKLGLQGTTVLVSSGDHGVGQNGDGCLGPDNSTFQVSGLAACPWVTSVGATKLASSNLPPTPFDESAAFDSGVNFSSGGGFSNYFTAPDYQIDTLSRYFYENPSPYPTYEYNGSISSLGLNGGRFPSRGRGIPDVSALGQNYTVVLGGNLLNIGAGTSASTPVFAAVIWRLNGERMAAGKGPVGFVNPVLYAHPQALNDVVRGNNPDCNSNGFEAVSGWDPVTGLGTPSYERMQALFMSLP
ncbi:hypothetical protein MMC10_008643 [Thelotrema lepadinum]|nr:hypothetical protein [Thelotrema lepadinum]